MLIIYQKLCQMKIVFISLILLINVISAFGNNTFNVVNYGADPSGRKDSFYAIQKLINLVSAIDGQKTIVFPQGKYLIIDNTLAVWGSDITIVGEGGVQLEKRGRAGWWGDLLNISGLIYGYNYYGLNGQKTFNIYRGTTTPAKNIIIQNITFQTNSKNISKNANNVGVINTNNVTFENCTFKNAPQTNVAIVNEGNKFSNYNVLINNCRFTNAGDHNLRVISYDSGKYLGNTVKVKNSKFDSISKPSISREIKNKNVHVWYRGRQKNTSLQMDNCSFDQTAEIMITMQGRGFELLNSNVQKGIIYKDGLPSDIKLRGNIFKNNKGIQMRNIPTDVKANNKIY